MLQYLSVVAPVIAIINGVIAVFVAQFKPDEWRAKIILLSIAITLGILAAGATILYQYNTVRQQQQEKDKRTEIRKRIAEFIVSSNTTMNLIRDKNTDIVVVEHEANRWYAEAQQYLATIGVDYLSRFQSTSGLSPIRPGGIEDQQRVNLWVEIYYRSTRLEQFASEFAR